MTIGKNIRKARDAAGLTQEKAGQLAGIRQTHWCSYETGKRLPGRETLRRIAKALGVTMDSLVETRTRKGK